MRIEVLKAQNVNEAVDQILNELRQDAAGSARSSGRHNVIYFDGWDGLGASAVLRAVGRRLIPAASQEKEPTAPAGPTGLEFSQIFHIDCSKWESRRAMQRMIAEQLKLPASVMEMFDTQDEEDDYRGIGKGFRYEIPQVAEVINQHIQNRFLLIFNNGSSEEIDLDSLGFPLLDRYSRSKVLWSFQGRFRFYPRTKVDMALKNTWTTNVFLSADSSDMGEDKLSDILGHEAEEVACKMVNPSGINWPAAAASYFLCVMKLRSMCDYDMSNHACNYWRCDDMIRLHQEDVVTYDGVDRLWLSSDALHREIQLDEDYYQNPKFSSLVERRLHELMARWTSPTYGFMLIHGQILKGIFHYFDKLCVLKLSACEFSFRSAPFFCCLSLRFLWLDHCQNGSNTTEVVEEDIRRFFQSLWVLDVRYSAFLKWKADMMDFVSLKELNVIGDDEFDMVKRPQEQLRNIRKLRITKSDVMCETIFSGMDKMEVIEFSKNEVMTKLSMESCCSLETVIINGPTDVENISLTACAKLKNVFLSGSFEDLESIVITGAAVEILDLSTVTASDLDEICLLHCEKLCAIFWPPAAEGRRERYMKRLRIDTTQKEGTTEHIACEAPGEFDWHVSVRDARILQSLESIKDYFSSNHAHVEISSPSYQPCVDDVIREDDRMKSSNGQHVEEKQKQLIMDNAIYADVAVTMKGINKQQKQANEGDADALTIMSICPAPPSVPSQGCYIHIDGQTRAKLQATSATIPAFVCDSAKILHVHDIAAAPLASGTWNQLEWCRIERCPKLGCVFSPQLDEGPEGSNKDMFKELRTFWASHLSKASHIWKWTGSSGSWFYGGTFENVTFLHIDYCPRLINIIHFPTVRIALDKLETLEIMWCGDLSEAFHFYDTPGRSVSYFGGWIFMKLKHVRLHELPKLQNICNIGLEVHKLKLKSIKIRGCWSLRRLPIVDSNSVVECNCEKEWWDRLEWASAEHASKYKLTYPRHYKKTMLKGSVLR